MTHSDSMPNRRALLASALSAGAAAMTPWSAFAQNASQSFAQWKENFRARGLKRGIPGMLYDEVMRGVEPDMGVFALAKAQPEFREQLWQYLNRRVSEWRITTGREKFREHAALFKRLDAEFGVSPAILLGLWGMETAFGDPLVHKNHMRPVIPALAALAWGEPRRRAYWETEFLNALTIIARGWSNPKEMRGSWAGAMGHTQWMPEVWLNIGFDFDGDGRVSPFGRPDDALAGTCKYLIKRGGYRPGEPWGYEVRAQNAIAGTYSYAEWQKRGVMRADGKAYGAPNARAALWIPVENGPAFLTGANFSAVKSYNPSMNYALAICHLGDRILGGAPFVQSFPGSERAPTLAEMQEIQKLLTAKGFDTNGTDGRVGLETMKAVRAYQRKMGIEPADGYAGVTLLARLRQN
jgi:membrane-bound lytic murein transglycosylase B